MEYMWLLALLVLLLVIMGIAYWYRDNILEQLQYALQMFLDKINPM